MRVGGKCRNRSLLALTVEIKSTGSKASQGLNYKGVVLLINWENTADTPRAVIYGDALPTMRDDA